MKPVWYRCWVKHDRGTTVLKVMATSVGDAIRKVCEAEGCPESAVFKVTTSWAVAFS